MRWRCPECREPVIRARTEAMSWQLLNPVPDEAGNVHAYEANGNWHARSVKPGTPAVPPDHLMMPHKATCAGKPECVQAVPEAPAELPGNVTQLRAWKKARRRRQRAVPRQQHGP